MYVFVCMCSVEAYIRYVTCTHDHSIRLDKLAPAQHLRACIFPTLKCVCMLEVLESVCTDDGEAHK